MEKVPFFTFTNIEKKNDIRFLSYFTHRKKWSCAFFWGPKKNPSKSTSSSPKRSRVDSIELTPPADTTCGNPVPPICHVVFFGGVVWVECRDLLLILFGHWPHTIKRGEDISIYIIYMCAVSFLFLDIYVFYLYP